MPRYEYKVVPAPTKGLKAKGVKTAEGRFSHAIQELMNGLAGYGWEYQRAETLPSVERSGLTSNTTEWRNVLVFRRPREQDVEAFAPELLPPPQEAPQSPEPKPEPVVENSPETSGETPGDTPAEAEKSSEDPWDNGVEDTSDVDGLGSTLKTLAAARKTPKTDS
ncbi:DUF4177 domain-containing protein [Sulfitobacter sp. F26204]|uniref:DUF4177 domain-containing protein n=1 Tax=Sulfitobacter sp. F26204 TaxID=2996014 RepID=UPI00225E64B1|nr:DUF4177 domain-containing protein [Sulfitobacter sp. F26204]MCX7559371.1 DUF4177 domain-containing protein [Sulfitobacter sp. F26204]